MWKKILLGLAALVGLFALVIAVQPSEFRVTRSARMAAATPDVFAQVNDFRNWEAWSPWAKLDPNCKNTFEGPPAGTGAVFAWSGNSDVCEGRMTITESSPYERIGMKLDFVRPFESTCNVEFGFKPEDGQTVVTWTMWGTNNFIGKAFSLFCNMDRMIGADFEKGLAQMKAAAEATARQ